MNSLARGEEGKLLHEAHLSLIARGIIELTNPLWVNEPDPTRPLDLVRSHSISMSFVKEIYGEIKNFGND